MEWGDRDENDYRLVPGTYMTVNEYRRSLGVSNFERYYLNNWATSSTATTTTNTVLYNGSPTVQMPTNGYFVNYGDAKWSEFGEPAKPAKVKKDRPETDMQWLKRRISEVSWVPV